MPKLLYNAQHDLIVEKYWSDLIQVLTEDENLRIRKNDMVELGRTDVVDFMRNLKLFETRMEQMVQRLEEQKQKNA